MKTFIDWLMPESASTISPQVDAITYFIFAVSLLFFFIIVVGMIHFVIKYRRQEKLEKTSGVDHNTALEIVWTAIPTVLLVVMFVWGFRVYLDMSIAPKDSLEIKVTGQKWFWTFTYPNGYVSPGELVVPLNQPVKTLISSKDVIHSMFVPAFRIKMDALPNRYTVAWFEATKEGTFPLYCTEYCGTSHSKMLATVKVLPYDQYLKWLDDASSSMDGADPVALGEKIYARNACNTCHSIDGSSMIGPSWRNIWSSSQNLSDGSSVVVDENYIRESILYPQKKIRAGYQGVMPSYQGLLKENEIEGVIAYIKSLEDK
ncbi:MAG: cytochrome c oxidase subunit II [Bdellovibrionales bacterium]|nr:cytochrome c oxidase subunit II [Bdellovibrionales bacterium]